MKINVVTVGTRLPDWINTGFYHYAQRMPAHLPVQLIEIAVAKHSKNYNPELIKNAEGKRLLSQIPENDWVIALEINGASWSTTDLAHQLERWQQQGSNISLLIGGAEGPSTACKQRAHQQWSLSALTLPHGLVRIIVAEQLYRAWTIHQHHPYHRE